MLPTQQAEVHGHSDHVLAVDFDATIAEYDIWRGHQHLGEPVPKAIAKVKQAMGMGRKVCIFTARVYPGMTYEEMQQATESYLLIADWCKKVFGRILPITFCKTRDMGAFWDDRATQFVPNTGLTAQEFAQKVGA